VSVAKCKFGCAEAVAAPPANKTVVKKVTAENETILHKRLMPLLIASTPYEGEAEPIKVTI